MRKNAPRSPYVGNTTRRRILQSILAAPALAGLAPMLRAADEDDEFIASAAEALDVFDFERLARAKLPPERYASRGTDRLKRDDC